MSIYYLQDSNNVIWNIGITTDGRTTYTVTTAVTAGSTYILSNLFGNYFQLGITIAGRETLTSVGSQPVTPIILIDSTGIHWQLGVDDTGTRVTATVLVPLIQTGFYSEDIWVGEDLG